MPYVIPISWRAIAVVIRIVILQRTYRYTDIVVMDSLNNKKKNVRECTRGLVTYVVVELFSGSSNTIVSYNSDLFWNHKWQSARWGPFEHKDSRS